MPRLSKQFKDAIRQIPTDDLQKLVIELAGKHKDIHDIINVRFVEKEGAEDELFEDTKVAIEDEMDWLSNRGPQEKNIARAMANCVKLINHYTKVTKNKRREADLLKFLIGTTFRKYEGNLGTCWTVFDSKLATTTKRFHTLVTKNLHEDLLMDYRNDLNRYLQKLHKNCNHLDMVFGMPKEV
jgi:uncharacterized protein YifE (UPF0438 family)